MKKVKYYYALRYGEIEQNLFNQNHADVIGAVVMVDGLNEIDALRLVNRWNNPKVNENSKCIYWI